MLKKASWVSKSKNKNADILSAFLFLLNAITPVAKSPVTYCGKNCDFFGVTPLPSLAEAAVLRSWLRNY